MLLCVFFFFFQLVYHALQLLAYSVLAILIMRLKLFLTPHLCVMASLVCSKQVRSLFNPVAISVLNSITQVFVLKQISVCVELLNLSVPVKNKPDYIACRKVWLHNFHSSLSPNKANVLFYATCPVAFLYELICCVSSLSTGRHMLNFTVLTHFYAIASFLLTINFIQTVFVYTVFLQLFRAYCLAYFLFINSFQKYSFEVLHVENISALKIKSHMPNSDLIFLA